MISFLINHYSILYLSVSSLWCYGTISIQLLYFIYTYFLHFLCNGAILMACLVVKLPTCAMPQCLFIPACLQNPILSTASTRTLFHLSSHWTCAFLAAAAFSLIHTGTVSLFILGFMGSFGWERKISAPACRQWLTCQWCKAEANIRNIYSNIQRATEAVVLFWMLHEE